MSASDGAPVLSGQADDPLRFQGMSHDKSSAHHAAASEELDLAIPDMDTDGAEERVKVALEKIPGIQSVRLLQRGAFIRYNPIGITKEEITTLIRRAGFRASTFQDSKSGETGVSSQ